MLLISNDKQSLTRILFITSSLYPTETEIILNQPLLIIIITWLVLVHNNCYTWVDLIIFQHFVQTKKKVS